MAYYKREQNFINLWSAQPFQGLELSRASYTTHVFPRHWNETFVIQLVEQGVNEFYCDGRIHTAPAGCVVLINPYEVHTGCSTGHVPLVYRTIYPATEFLSTILKQLHYPTDDAPLFSRHAIRDKSLAVMIQKTHRAFEMGGDRLACESIVFELLAYSIRRYSNKKSCNQTVGNEKQAVKRAKEYMQAHFADPITLDQLARISALSPFHFLRAFHRQVGLPPHEYLVNVRVERAKAFLGQGHSIAQAAYKTGFCDQSHLTRRFKPIVGVTPGQYLKKRKIVQE